MNRNRYRRHRDHSTPPALLARDATPGAHAAPLAARAGTTWDINIYAGVDEAARRWPRNPACWAAQQDLTCVSPYNDRFGHFSAGTLITPRHVLNAWHFMPEAGTTYWFARNDGSSVTRVAVAATGDQHTDIGVTQLDEDLPPEFQPALLLDPGRIATIADTLDNCLLVRLNAAKAPGDPFPVVPPGNYHPSKQALAAIYETDFWPELGYRWIIPQLNPYAANTGALIEGDSGSLIFLVNPTPGAPPIATETASTLTFHNIQFTQIIQSIIDSYPENGGHQLGYY